MAHSACLKWMQMEVRRNQDEVTLNPRSLTSASAREHVSTWLTPNIDQYYH